MYNAVQGYPDDLEYNDKKLKPLPSSGTLNVRK
jgi:hypothetical protein